VVARAACLADRVHRCCGRGIGFLLACAIVSFPLAILALVPLGALYLQVFDAAQTTSPNLEAFATGEGTVDVTAHVVREGIARDSPYGDTQESVDVETEQLSAGDHVLNASVGVRLTIFSKRAEEEEARDAGADSALLVYTYGERLHFPAKLRAPRNYGNPGALDLSGYLASQDVRLTGSGQASEVEVLPASRAAAWGYGAAMPAAAY